VKGRVKGELRTFLKDVQLLGWSFVGYGGNSHPHLQHTSGARYVLSLSPSDRHGRRNALADLERVAGIRLATAKSARKRR
jgi:hypothetical protein